MLDTDTKRRIDSCRGILVGKVPDPKSQVKQISIALIYKFMDHMDAGAAELGGKRSFFAGKYAKYGWAKFMAQGVGGFDMLALYSEAIGKMAENPGIRPLFRDAYLPYRAPKALKSYDISPDMVRLSLINKQIKDPGLPCPRLGRRSRARPLVEFHA